MDLSSLEEIISALSTVYEYISEIMGDIDFSSIIDTISTLITTISALVA